MTDQGALYFDGSTAVVAIPDGRGGVVEYRTRPGRPKEAVRWLRGNGDEPAVAPFADVAVSWSPSQDPDVIGAKLARDCGAAMCRNEANFARARERLASAIVRR